MSRGNKRQVDRARAQARAQKAEGKTLKDKDGLTPEEQAVAADNLEAQRQMDGNRIY